MFNWGTNLKAPLPGDGLPWVDDAHHVWQWSDARQAWARAPYLELRKVISRFISAAGRPVGTDIFGGRTGRLALHWDDDYPYAFVEVLATDGTVRGRSAHMSKADLDNWLGSVINSSGGIYGENIMFNVYEVFDTRLHLEKWNAWNGFYGSFRGRDCYTSAFGSGRWGLQPCGGYASGFGSHHTVFSPSGEATLEQALMNHWYGAGGVPSTPEKRFCWSARKKRTLYRLPKQGATFLNVGSMSTGRYVWDWGSSDWSAAPVGWYDFHPGGGGVVGSNPAILRRDVDGTTVVIEAPSTSFRGQLGVLGGEFMVAYLLRNAADPNLVGALIQPYGVTKAAFMLPENVDLTNYDVVSVGKFRGVPTDPTLWRVDGAGVIELRSSGDGIRLPNLAYIVGQHTRTFGGSPQDRGVDSPSLPTDVHFYLRHKSTGIRSEESTPHIELLHRKHGIPLAISFRTA